MFFLIPARTPRNPPNRPAKAAPDPQDIVDQRQEIADLRSRGGGPVSHPQHSGTLPGGN